jgi:acyl carrier protein
MAKLSIIVLADDDFNKKLTGETMREFKTVGDIITFLSA